MIAWPAGRQRLNSAEAQVTKIELIDKNVDLSLPETRSGR